MTGLARLATCAAWLAVAAAPAMAQGVYGADVRRALESVRPAALEAHLRFLADDLMEGRGTGTRGYALAARYVEAQFQRLGLEPAGERGTWEQAVPLQRAVLLPERCGLTLIGERSRELTMGRDFLMAPDVYRPQSDVTADVVFVGYGVSAPELGYDDLAGVDPRGKIVAVFSGAPAQFAHTVRAHYSNGRVKDANLAAHGAIGVLTIRTPVDERRSSWARLTLQYGLPSMRWLDARGIPDGVAPEIQCSATVDRATAEALFQGAERSLAETFAAAEQGKLRGFPLRVKARMRRASRHDAVASPNVAGLWRGSDRQLESEVVVLSAHLDHLGIGPPVNGDSVYNGAFDNATGVACLIEIAAAFAHAESRPRRSLLFLAVTGEEKGLQGSSYFVRHPTLAVDRLVADLNLDMYVMVGPLREVVAHGAEHSTLSSIANLAAARMGLRVVSDPDPEQVVFVRSDQYSFVRVGVPSLYVTGSSGAAGQAARQAWSHDRYHSPQDDLDQPLDMESLARFARLHYLMVDLAANQPARPQWNANDFFGERYGRR